MLLGRFKQPINGAGEERISKVAWDSDESAKTSIAYVFPLMLVSLCEVCKNRTENLRSTGMARGLAAYTRGIWNFGY